VAASPAQYQTGRNKILGETLEWYLQRHSSSTVKQMMVWPGCYINQAMEFSLVFC